MKKIGDVTSTADKNGEWTNGNVAAGIAPTILDAAWLNSVQREILGVIIAAGLQQDKNDDIQLSKAISKIISGGNYATAEDLKKYLAKDQNGADIPNKDTFIKNLGLPEKYQQKGNYQPAGDYPLTSSVFGIGQKWYGMTTQRKLETVYKNNTGKGIYIAVCLASDGIAGLVSMKMYVDDVPVGTNQVQVLGEKGRYTYATVATFVPAGSSYYLTVPAAESQLNINSWSEMR
ncbi:hypothetical protein [Morganella morganii]|uniref:hypothetical protein n=1 Tax=Morganella morganii TaxID=582 RepID=UPI0025A53A64|nr:hypothetical protein [Morganella morganii]